MWIWQMVVGELVGFHQGKLDGWLLGLSAGAVVRWMTVGNVVVVAGGWVWKMGKEEGFSCGDGSGFMGMGGGGGG